MADTIEQKLDNIAEKLEKKAGEDAKKAANEAVAETKKLLGDAQAKAEAAETKANAAEKEAGELKSEVKVMKDAADKNQAALDELLVKSKRQPFGEGETKSFNDKLKDAVEENSDAIARFARKETKSFGFEIKGVKPHEIKAVGDVTTANVTGGSVWGSVYRPGIIELPKRKVHMRNVLNVGRIGAGTDYYFMAQNGVGEGNPAPTAEGAQKPQMDDDLIEKSVKIEVIAGFERVTRKAMLNIPGFVSFLQSRMPERLLRVEDAQILYGDGASPNLKGILTAGNFTASTSTATILAGAILDDIALLEDTYEREANIILLRSAAYNSIWQNVAAGSGEYNLPANFVMGADGMLRISGIPVYKTTALNASDYIVGDSTGAEFEIQEDIRIEFFEQDVDNVQKNKVTVRIEETVALPVFGATYFIKGTVPA